MSPLVVRTPRRYCQSPLPSAQAAPRSSWSTSHHRLHFFAEVVIGYAEDAASATLGWVIRSTLGRLSVSRGPSRWGAGPIGRLYPKAYPREGSEVIDRASTFRPHRGHAPGFQLNGSPSRVGMDRCAIC
jgi:hypothetical protein